MYSEQEVLLKTLEIHCVGGKLLLKTVFPSSNQIYEKRCTELIEASLFTCTIVLLYN